MFKDNKSLDLKSQFSWFTINHHFLAYQSLWHCSYEFSQNNAHQIPRAFIHVEKLWWTRMVDRSQMIGWVNGWVFTESLDEPVRSKMRPGRDLESLITYWVGGEMSLRELEQVFEILILSVSVTGLCFPALVIYPRECTLLPQLRQRRWKKTQTQILSGWGKPRKWNHRDINFDFYIQIHLPNFISSN